MKVSITTRRKILSLLNEGKAPKEIASILNVPLWSVYNVSAGRVRTKYTPRKDKGMKRKYPFAQPGKELTDFASEEDFLQYQVRLIMNDLSTKTYDADARMKILKDISVFKKQIHDRELERYLKRPDAVLVARLMRRFDAKLTDDDIIRIVKEEQTKMSAENPLSPERVGKG